MPPRGDYPSSKQDQYMLRFPDGMRERLKSEAERNNRSMNAEIIARLEESFDASSELQKRLDELRVIEAKNDEIIRRYEQLITLKTETIGFAKEAYLMTRVALARFAKAVQAAAAGNSQMLDRLVQEARERPLDPAILDPNREPADDDDPLPTEAKTP